jgi:precorrin-2 dehydrogenase/sirohydrochlorin ferrochelatase
MLPIVLSGVTPVGVAGTGEGLARRLAVLAKAGLQPTVYSDRLPTEADLAKLRLLFVAGLPETAAADLAAAAREAGVLVNVEDVPHLCDFHVPAQIRRGDLLFTISTAGRSPGLARILKETIEASFGPEWEGRLEELAKAREAWRAEGLKPEDVAARTRALLGARGWLA